MTKMKRGPKGARLRAIATLGDQSHRTAKAIAWVRTNYAKPLRVEDLARIAGMGVSTLHHHFRALTTMSPLQYQKQLRLHAARERMLMDGLDAASAVLRSDTKVPVNSIANTVASSASHLCEIFGLYARRALSHWSWSVIGKALCDRVADERDFAWRV